MFENSLAMDIHLEDRSNHLLFSHVQLNFFLPELVFFHMGISLGKKKKEDNNNNTPKNHQNPEQQKAASGIWLYWIHSKMWNVFSEAMLAEKTYF